MPYSPQKPCSYPGCSKLIDPKKKYCKEHEKLFPEYKRNTRKTNGYNKQWMRESKKFLATHPFCVRCKKAGRVTPATVVDHIIPHRNNKQLFWDRSNWQALCKPCHDKKTWTEDARIVYSYDEI